MFEIGKRYNFFDDGKITSSRHFIATVIDIIPIVEFNNAEIIYNTLKECSDYNPELYNTEPKDVIICEVPVYCRGPFICIKMKHSDCYFSVGSSYWCGMLATKQWCLDNIVNNKCVDNALKRSLVL